MNAGSTGGVQQVRARNLTLTAVNSQTGEFRINEGIVALTGNGTWGITTMRYNPPRSDVESW